MVLKCDKCDSEDDIETYHVEMENSPPYQLGSLSIRRIWDIFIDLCPKCRDKAKDTLNKDLGVK
jgi:hypothetical protein